MAYTNLFRPITLGGVEIRNRTAMAPMGIGAYSPDEEWPGREYPYYEERAKGGIGLIITQFVSVHEKLACIPVVGIHSDRLIPSHKKLVDRVHKHGAKIFLQIALMGGRFGGHAPSAIYNVNYPQKPRALTTDELDELVEAYIAAAGRGLEAGYDGVELHGGHTYLVGQLVSPATNLRTDKYGGSFEKRMKFPTDIVQGIRRRYPELPIGYKFSAYEEVPGGVDIELGKKIAKQMESLKIDYLHVSTTASANETLSSYPSVPPMYIQRNTLIPLAEGIKKSCPDTTILGAGSIILPDEADSFIGDGKCDMVVLGRTVLADPHWPKKSEKGQPFTPCIRCNFCYYELFHMRHISCSLNPYVGHEAEQDLPVPARKKKVMVIGGGPAGFRCAVTAAKRGHTVTLYEKQPYLGGMLYPGSRPDCKEDMRPAIDWFEAELAKNSVTVKTSTEVTPEMVAEEGPDAVVVAVGSEPGMPEIPGIAEPYVAPAVEVLRDLSRFSGKKAVVIGGGDVGCETACFLHDNGWEVSIVEVLPKLMMENDNINLKIYLLKLVEDKEIPVYLESRVTRIYENKVEFLLPTGKEWGLDADLVAVATGVSPKAELAQALSVKAEESYVIGDCACVGLIPDATMAGERVGRWI